MRHLKRGATNTVSRRWRAALLCAAVGCAPAAGAQQSGPIAPLPRDVAQAMTSTDKALHAGGSAAMVVAVYGASAPFLPRAWQRTSVAVAVVGVAGVAKKGFDVVRGGRADVLDLVADVVGIAIGTGVMLTLEAVLHAMHPASTSDRSDIPPE